jgi:capsid protein
MGWFGKYIWGPKADEPTQIQATSEIIYPPNEGRFTGQKYAGGVSGQIDEISSLDYWALRARSAALFNVNSYAKGIIRRLVTNMINVGLSVESIPEELILGLAEDSLVEWSETIETRFQLWASSPEICDIKGVSNFGSIQRSIYREALIEGDCLVIDRQDPFTKLPQLQVIPGGRVMTPPTLNSDGTVIDGVKIDDNGKHLGYWVYRGTTEMSNDQYVYIPAFGENTGRRNAWLVYGFDKREDGIRGEPLLAVAIQPLNEIDRYRDSAQRKAFINSMIVGFIKRSNDGPGSLPIQGAAVKAGTVTADLTGAINPVGVAEILPGVFMERLQPGEEPAPYSNNGTDVNFGQFEASIMVGLAWALEIPPEILLLSFNKNYSASQAAVNEFKILQNRERSRFGAENNDLVFTEWFISELLLGKFQAPGFLESWNDPSKYDVKKAWLMTDWSGAIKPSTDMVKQANGYKLLVGECWITNDRAAREQTGTKFSKNCRRVAKENEMKLAAVRPILEANQEFGEKEVTTALSTIIIEGTTDDDLVDDTIRS